jgi:ribosomal-protein-serine acetyltransferase
VIRFPALLETSRLVIRTCDPATADLVNAAIRESFDQLHEWLPWADTLPSVEDTRTHLSSAQRDYIAGTDWGLGLWLKNTGGFVGGSGLHPRPSDPSWREIGYWIHSAHTGQGLATEAVRAITEAGFASGVVAVQAKISERNAASVRVVERAGFTREAILDDGTVLFVRRR